MDRARIRAAAFAAVRNGATLACAAALAACAGVRAPAPANATAAAATANVASAASVRGATGAGSDAAAPSENDAAIAIAADDPTWGSRTALVTVVEFSDFQCPFCARVEPTMARLRESYGPEVLRIVWKNSPLPFHANARGAAEAGAGVRAMGGNDAFWRFRDAAFAGQRALGEDRYVAWAAEAGVRDTSGFRAGLHAGAWAARVDGDLDEATRLGVDGTPSFFINGVPLVGAQPYEAFREIVDAQLVAAKAKIAGGTPAARVYVELSKENVAARPAESAPDDDDTKTTYRVPVGKSPARGAAAAPVTIVEFADYECPFCARAEATLRNLRDRYGADLRVVFKDAPLPFHEHAEPAAQAALEVRLERGDAAFWAMHDTLFDHPDRLNADDLVGLAVAAGADARRVRSAMTTHRHAASIAADEDLADDLGIDGTPQFFVNGHHIAGAQPEPRFVAVVDAELAKARARIAQGTKPDALYDAIAKDGQAPQDPERKDATALPAGDPARGPTTAKVTIHEFGDFQCPFCVRAEPTLEKIVATYGGRVRVVWHDLPLPFHEHAMEAARAAREARRQRGDAAFWDLHDCLMKAEGKVDRALLDDQAAVLGLDGARWKTALDSDAAVPAIEADRQAAEALALNGTPSFLVVAAGAKSGTVIVGAQSFVRFRKLVERALAEAQ